MRCSVILAVVRRSMLPASVLRCSIVQPTGVVRLNIHRVVLAVHLVLYIRYLPREGKMVMDINDIVYVLYTYI